MNLVKRITRYNWLWIISLAVLGPCIADILVWIPIHSVADQPSWLGFFGNYFGGIIGGLVAWFVARYQIRLDSQRHMNEERLKSLYAPAFSLLSRFNQRGAHLFLNLTKEERGELIKIIGENIVYADAELWVFFNELQWALGSKDNVTNRKNIEIQYRHIGTLIEKEFYRLRKEMNLPDIGFGQVDLNRTQLYKELEQMYFPYGYTEE